MKESTRILVDKMLKVIDSCEDRHEDVAAKYVRLGLAQLSDNFQKTNDFCVFFADVEVVKKWYHRFGYIVSPRGGE